MKMTIKDFKEIIDLLKDDLNVTITGCDDIQVSKKSVEIAKAKPEVEPTVINIAEQIDFNKCDKVTIQNKMFAVYVERLSTGLNEFMGSICLTENEVPDSVTEFYSELIELFSIFRETRLVDFERLCKSFNKMEKDCHLPLSIHDSYCRLAALILEVDDENKQILNNK